MSEKLKPCPFCGAMPETDGKLVQCYLMPCDFRRFKMPVEAWNTRPIEDDLHARIAELEAAQLVGWLIKFGNVLLNQDGMDNDVVTAAENEWRKLVAEWRER